MRTIRFASIVVTYRCNARCHMCNTWQHPSKCAEEITVDDIARLPSIPIINITGGEPLLRDDLAEILTVLRPKTERVVISTNGYYTDRLLALAHQHPWIGVRISIEGLPKANDELRGIADGFDHGIRSLVALRHHGITDVGFGITLSDRNVLDLMELYHLAKLMGVEFATAVVHNSYYFHKFDNRINKHDAMVRELNMLIAELMQSKHPKDWFRAFFNYGLIRHIQGHPRMLPCEMGTDSFFLDPYGEVMPCNVMEQSMGNIKEQDFADIWESPTAGKVRQCVSTCTENCWMIGSVAEPMKKYITTPLKWIYARKFQRRRSSEMTVPVAENSSHQEVSMSSRAE